MKKNLYSFALLLSTIFSIFLCHAMNPQRPADKGWADRAGKALARTSRFIGDEWWNGSHVPSILRECELGKFDRDATEKDGRLNIGNFESALIELIAKRKAEDITFVLEKGLKMKSHKDSSSATILKEINRQRLEEAKDIIYKKEETIADTTVAEINTFIADRARQMDEMRRLKALIDNGFVETNPSGPITPAKLVILQKLQQSPQFCGGITSFSSSESAPAVLIAAATAATLLINSSPSLVSTRSQSVTSVSSPSSPSSSFSAVPSFSSQNCLQFSSSPSTSTLSAHALALSPSTPPPSTNSSSLSISNDSSPQPPPAQ